MVLGRIGDGEGNAGQDDHGFGDGYVRQREQDCFATGIGGNFAGECLRERDAIVTQLCGEGEGAGEL